MIYVMETCLTLKLLSYLSLEQKGNTGYKVFPHSLYFPLKSQVFILFEEHCCHRSEQLEQLKMLHAK